MKSIFKSKTFWINVITVLVAIFALPEVNELIDPQITLIIVGVLNIVLRAITNEGVTLNGVPLTKLKDADAKMVEAFIKGSN